MYFWLPSYRSQLCCWKAASSPGGAPAKDPFMWPSCWVASADASRLRSGPFSSSSRSFWTTLFWATHQNMLSSTNTNDDTRVKTLYLLTAVASRSMATRVAQTAAPLASIPALHQARASRSVGLPRGMLIFIDLVSDS